MPYKLKANAPEFDAVDGPFAGKKYRRGEVYAEVPDGDKGRFETVGRGTTPRAHTSPEQANPGTAGKVKKNDASDTKKVASEKPKGGSK